MRVLLTWIGAQDPWRRAEGRPAGRLETFSSLEKPAGFVDGPIFTFLKAAPRFDRLVLLYNPPLEKNGAVAAFTEELRKRFEQTVLQPKLLSIPHPRDYEALYRGMRSTCEAVRAEYGAEAECHILLSPGTPQMHAIWVLLAKTVFPAKTWQSSDHEGEEPAEQVHVPFDIDAELLEPARREGRMQARTLAGGDIIAQSPAMERALSRALRVAQESVPVLLLGESGVGKQCVAEVVHYNSRRKGKPFVAFNCGALPEALAESVLFGHAKGAFTGAFQATEGLFRAAEGGTLFLDEVGDLPLSLQVKLLRVLQEKKILPVGVTREIPIDVRIIAATNHDLEKAVAEKKFRSDLYYRLNVVSIYLPPLRERREDIAPLAEYFLARFNEERKKEGLPMIRLLPSARHRLAAHSWPGNIRELNNCLTLLSINSKEGKIDLRLVEDELPPLPLDEAIGRIDLTIRHGRGLNEILEEVERKLLEEAWKKHRTQKAAAKALGLNSQQAFQKRCGVHGIIDPKLSMVEGQEL